MTEPVQPDTSSSFSLSGISLKLSTISSIAAGVVAILGSIWAIDTHYASAADVTQIKQEFTQQIVQMRKEKVEDTLFELDIKRQSQNGKLSPLDQAMYDRYTRRLQEYQGAAGVPAK